MKKLLAALLMVAGCMRPVPPQVPVDVVAVAPLTWEIQVPDDWQRQEFTPPAPMVISDVTATSPQHLGRAPVVLHVTVFDLQYEEVSDGDFGGAAVEAMKHSDYEVTSSETRRIAGSAGMASIIKKDALVFIQHTVGIDGRGYVVRCGGDADEEPRVLSTCQPLLDTFRIKR